LGLPTQVHKKSTYRAIYPTLSYSDNINGGNSSKPLVIGKLTLQGDETLYRKEGIVTGFGAGFGGRHIHSEGKYITYGFNVGYAYSLKHELGIATTSANISSINHIKNWWYIDLHANISRVRKEITDETNSTLSLVSSKVYKSGNNTYSEASFGVNHYFAESYEQYQLLFGYKTIHANGIFSVLSLTVGENVASKLATRFALSGQLTTQLAKKPLRLSASYSNAVGGMLLGIARDETTIALSASYPIWKNLSVSVGYRETDSTIDYFDVRTPTFGIQFSAIQL